MKFPAHLDPAAQTIRRCGARDDTVLWTGVPSSLRGSGAARRLTGLLRGLIAVAAGAVLLGTLPFPTVADEAAPPEALGRYHVTVVIQEESEAGGPRVHQTVTRDLRDASGIIISAGGLVVTAAHVARTTRNKAVVRTFDGARYEAEVLHVLPNAELAVLKTTRPWRFDIGPPALSPGPAPGHDVTGVGLAAGGSSAARPGTVLLPRYDHAFRFNEFSFRAPIVLKMQVESGFSGGPVFDDQDRWLGMIVGYGLTRDDDGEVVNTGQTYVLPARRVLALVKAVR